MLMLVLLVSQCIIIPAPVMLQSGPLQLNRAQVSTSGPAAYVNPFIGTKPGGAHFGVVGDNGDTIPGAAYPTGMMQWSPDTPSPVPGGYFYPDSSMKGFSLTHFSGRGCRSEQDFPFMPYIGNVTASPATNASLYQSTFSHSTESAHPGYYSVQLDKPEVRVELTVAALTGMGRFTYPASSLSTVLINAGGSALGNSAAMVALDPTNNEVSGSATSIIGCGKSSYTIYFVAQFDHTFTRWGTWNGATVQQKSTGTHGRRTGAFVTFGTNHVPVVHVRVGISYVSLANARGNLLARRPGFDFNAMQTSAAAAWNQRLNTIKVTGGTAAQKTTFYTALYHSFFHPNRFNDANGEYLGFDGKIHTVPSGHIHFENIPGWDAYRSLMPLLSIISPHDASDIAQSLVDDAVQGDGHIPRWEQANVDSHGMNGDGGSIMIADAYAYGNTHFDTQAALQAMINGQPQLRESYADYISLGYIPAAMKNDAASTTQEYTNADFAIGRFAQSLGKQDIARTALKRAQNWRLLFNSSSGYIQVRERNGSWKPDFDPARIAGFTEGNSAQYSWMEPFDLPQLFQRMGGNATVVQRLDTFFKYINIGPQSPYSFMGNEPGLGTPWEYDFAQAPSHTQAIVRRIQRQLFNSTPNGLPGNDDGGATSSWYVFSALGIYPEVPGVSGFVVGSPAFPSATIQLANGHTLTINAPEASASNFYIQSLKINNIASSQLWLPWSKVKNGATLTFSLGQHPNNWGSRLSDAPPVFLPA
ncbi:hypothetical protein KDA_22120 [Dictyobacter alpinus]|uniref:Alpha-1,2-mannosidase n=1 Tax=Dictyobacter alpinus TaxID=2014873 RepID=A0A402B5V0_9CHLR|nr:hypothetical protein KDA_22120 [Dictyobacter alpinus]